MTSVFTLHRDKVLGHYSTASWLRQLVLAMWNGTDYQVGLSNLAMVDADHFSAAMAMINSYRQHGERDAAFMNLAVECQQRIESEQAASERAGRLEDWCKATQYAVKQSGGRAFFVDDHYGWFEGQFEAGMAPEAAAALATDSNLDGTGPH